MVPPSQLDPAQKTTTTSIQSSEQIWTTATRFALTRFPFPPFTIRINTATHKTTVNQVMTDLQSHFSVAHHIKIDFSFSHLLVHENGPPLLARTSYLIISNPPIPPQLSLMLKNVDASTNMDDLTEGLKTAFPSIKNVIRLKNQFGNNTHLVKVELTSSTERELILARKRLMVNHVSYTVAEYLAPATVLICSKCCGLGHFRKQCKEIPKTCRICGQGVPDLKLHNCSATLCCKHCNGDHPSN